MKYKFIPIPNTNLLEQLRFEHNQIGISLYLTVLEMIIKEPNLKLKLSDMNLEILSNKLKMDEEKMYNFLKHWTEENDLNLFDKNEFENGYLYSQKFADDLKEISKI